MLSWLVRVRFWALMALLGAGAMPLTPVVHAETRATQPSAELPLPGDKIILEIYGDIANTNVDGAALFDMEMLEALPPATLETTTAVTDGVHRFDGVLMRDVLARVGADAQTVSATALNDYTIDIPAEDLERFDILLAYRMDGQRLLSSDKGPLWIVYPRDQHEELQDIRYDYRWVWQLYRLDIK